MSELQQIQYPEPEPLPELSFRDQVKQRFDFAWTYIFVVLVGLIVIFTIWHGQKFFDRTNFRNIALDSSQLMLLAIGMTFVIITAGIDLSVSAVLVFSAVVGAKVMSRLSGSPEQVKAYDSISFASMTEPERPAFIDFAFKTVSSWLGVPVEDLVKEGRDAA